jgi:hypothetical protein
VAFFAIRRRADREESPSALNPRASLAVPERSEMMRPLSFPYSLTPFPTLHTVGRTLHRTLARASVSWLLLGNPSHLPSLGVRAYFSAKLSASAMEFTTRTLIDWLR